MKRLLSVVLVLLVGIVPVAAVANQERMPVEHLLWDIPFGIGVEEYVTQVKEQLVLELDVELDVEFNELKFTSPNDELRLCDYPVTLYAAFNADGALEYLEVEGFSSIPQEDWEAFTSRFLQSILEMLEKAERNYGEALGGIVEIERGAPEEWFRDTERYSLPIIDGMPGKNALKDVFAEDAVFFRATYYYNGVRIGMALTKTKTREEYYRIGFGVSVRVESLEDIRRAIIYGLEGLHSYSELGDKDME